MPYKIEGPVRLFGEVNIQGSKNGALVLMTAALLIQGKTIFENCPTISDVDSMQKLLSYAGCKTIYKNHQMSIDAEIVDSELIFEEALSMRSSIMLLGPLLGRCKKAHILKPGGCVIGERPIDIHIKALEKMNVHFDMAGDEIVAFTKGLEASEITLSFPSVGATENVIMAAVYANGETVLHNAAAEPEIQMLCLFLRQAGVTIRGIGSSTLYITGIKKEAGLKECQFHIWPDRICAGTYMLGAAASKGDIFLKNAPFSQLLSVVRLLEKMGALVKESPYGIYVDAKKADCSLSFVKTQVYPGFPTDLQSVLLVALSQMEGVSVIEESIFENRFRVVNQLWKMGASIVLTDSRAQIRGKCKLSGAKLEAAELRGGAALVIAALCAEGMSLINGEKYIERGYEDICRDLNGLGAQITKIQ